MNVFFKNKEKQMKKILVALSALTVLATASFGYQSQSVMTKGNSANVDYKDGIVFVYDRMDYSIQNQTERTMQLAMDENICSSKNTRELANKNVIIFVYLFKNGTMSLTLDGCK